MKAKKKRRKQFMNRKFLKSLILSIMVIQNLNRCLVNFLKDILLKKSARLFKLIKKEVVFKVLPISLMTKMIQTRTNKWQVLRAFKVAMATIASKWLMA